MIPFRRRGTSPTLLEVDNRLYNEVFIRFHGGHDGVVRPRARARRRGRGPGRGVSRPKAHDLDADSRHRKPSRVPGSCGDAFLGGGEIRAFCWLSWSHALTGISLAVA